MTFGACGHIGRIWTESPETYIEKIKSINANAFRSDVTWGRVEPSSTPGTLAFPGTNAELIRLNNSINVGLQNGVDTMLILDYGNSGYGPSSPPGYKGGLTLTSEEISAFTNYASHVTEQTVGRVSRFEVWNEWNIGLGATQAQKDALEYIDPQKYQNLVESVYPAIKQKNQNAEVIVGAFSEQMTVRPQNNEWIEKYLDIPNWHEKADGFSFHHYFGFSRPENWFYQVRGTSEMVKRKSPKPMPTYVTETGWFNGTDSGSISEELAAEYYSRWPLLLRCTGVKEAYFYSLRDDASGPEKENSFGIYNFDYTEKLQTASARDAIKAAVDAYKAEYYNDNDRHLVVFNDGEYFAVWGIGSVNFEFETQSPVQVVECGKSTTSHESLNSIQLGWTAKIVYPTSKLKVIT